jgi:hypothetical protein
MSGWNGVSLTDCRSHAASERPAVHLISLTRRTTYPAKWDGKLFLHVSPSDPVNALAHSEISYVGGDWPVEYDVDMPEGVSGCLAKQSSLLRLTGYS